LMPAYLAAAWLSGTTVAVAAAVAGFFIVRKNAAFFAHALPKAGFAGAAGAVFLGVNPLYGLAVFAVGGALAVSRLEKREQGDVATALTLVAALGAGALFLVLTGRYATGAYALLFGQIVGVTGAQVLATAGVGALCLLAVAFLYRPLLLVTHAREVAEARGLPVGLVETGFLLVTALAVTVAVPVAGALLSFSLLIGPAAAANHLTCRPGKAMALSVVFSLLTVWLSLTLAYLTGWPTGFFVSAVVAGLYLGTRALAAASRI